MPGIPMPPSNLDTSPGNEPDNFTRPRSQAVSESDLPTDTYKSMLWCPSIDQNIKSIAAKALIKLPDIYPRLLEGGKKELDKFKPTQKLYIVAHGDPRMPIFRTNKTFSATELADLLVKDGLSLEQKEIELLVCHAGESVNSSERAGYLMRLRNKIDGLRSAGRTAEADTRSQRLQQEARSEPPPEFYDAANSKGRELPLGAQLVQALKGHNFTNLLVICYQSPISDTFTGGVVCLDLKNKKRTDGSVIEDPNPVRTDTPSGQRHRVIWRACK
jgi:hypothetical protein